MTQAHVFHDPTGRRRRLIRWTAVVSAVVLAVVIVLFGITAVTTPILRNPLDESAPPQSLSHPRGSEHARELSEYLLKRARNQLQKEIDETRALARRASKTAAADKWTMALASMWQETSLHSLRSNISRLTHVLPEFLHLTKEGDGLDFSDWTRFSSENQELVELARDNGVKVIARLTNTRDNDPDPESLHALLSSPLKQKKLARAIKTWLAQQGFEGVNFDFQGLAPKDYARLSAFLTTVRGEFAPAHLLVSVTFNAKDERMPLWRLASLCDFVVVHIHNEHELEDAPGPLASTTWFANELQKIVLSIPQSKVVVAFDSYGVDWNEGVQKAEGRSYLNTMTTARDSHPGESPQQVISFDPLSLNPTFRYTDAEGGAHTVWFLDAVSAYNQWLFAVRANVRGVAVGETGVEDPGVWSFISRTPEADGAAIEGLSHIRFPYQIEFEGRGDILRPISSSQDGERQLSVDPSNGQITAATYVTYPSSVIVERSGYQEKSIAITFDDGPHEPYTGQLLDIFKKEKIHATFFLIGENVQRDPAMVRRILAEGHDIGNHTFTHPDMASVSAQRRMLELNATQRTIQSITGRSTVLMRPPYIGEDDPTTTDEVEAMRQTNELHYTIVGISNDAEDWTLWKTDDKGQKVRRTGKDLLEEILRRLDRMQGNIILLHDGGGDRSATVEAVRLLIPELRGRGYQFKSVSELMGVPRSAILPSVTNNDLVLGGFSRFVFETFFSVKFLLSMTLTVLVILGMVRLGVVVILAVASRMRDRYDDDADAEVPSSTVVIAAYNEEKVIRRTIESILASDVQNFEIIVVDDGSSDGTSEEVRTHFGDHPKVRLIRQENSGKAGALNNGIGHASHEVLVCLDADTQFSPDAIRLMVRHFKDPRVGAVAGNVKVGNRTNVLTHWQSIEYIYNISLNRRAYAMLNAITVVAGASGAWRKSAVLEVGGYHGDTLAEDMDLTWRIRRADYRVLNETGAIGYTEAPTDLRGLFKQRFRWAYGSLQCLWKHRDAIFRYGWFGWLGIPTVLLFQVLFELIAPLADLQMLYSLGQFLSTALAGPITANAEMATITDSMFHILKVVVLYVTFFGVELGSTVIAFRLDRESMKPLWLLFFQRFVYRQLMYVVAWRAVWRAASGWRQGWGVLRRTGTVTLPGAATASQSK